MRRQILIIWLCCVMARLATAQAAQPLCTPGNKLYCLVPNQLGTPSKEFTALNEAVGTVVSDLPLASPASGVIYRVDPQLKLSIPSDTTLGPILTQRPETVGKHKIYVSLVYQYFKFSEVDGTSLASLPSVTETTDLAFVTTNALGLWVSQFSGYLTVGLTSRIDVSVAIPVLDVHEAFLSRGSKVILGTSATPVYFTLPNSGSAAGLGDIVLAGKGTIWKPASGGLAVGLELRVPTGDEENFLGSGTTGLKPYVSAAFGKRVSFHGDFGYQVNGDTKLVNSGKGQLPNRMFESAGIDWGASKWITLVADVLGERVFNAHRIAIISSPPVNQDVYQTIDGTPPVSSYNRTDGSFGAKVEYGKFIATGNVLVNFDEGGLRARLVPLGGISYTF